MSERIKYPLSMGESEKKEAENPTELVIESGDTQSVIIPEKGGMVASLKINGEEILFVDTEAVNDLKNPKPKAGIPNLIPYAGNLNKQVDLQHGGAREVPWVWQDRTESSVTASVDTRDLPEDMREKLKVLYGKDFEYRSEVRTAVRENQLSYSIILKNNGKESAPFAPGIHPYFQVDFEDRNKVTSNLEDFDISKMNQDRPLVLNVTKENPWFILPNGKKITLELSEEFKHVVIWGLDGADHLCIEPFVANPSDISEYETLDPGEEKSFKINIRIEEVKEEIDMDLVGEARTKIKDFLEKAAQVEEMFDADEWALNENNGNYKELAGQALLELIQNCLLMLSASDALLLKGDQQLRDLAVDFQQNYTEAEPPLGAIQGYAVFLTELEKNNNLLPQERQTVQEFCEQTALLAADFLEKMAGYGAEKIESLNNASN